MRAPKLCVTVTAGTMAELRERRDRVSDADLVELRVDSVRDPSAAGALAGRRTPVIVTCRAAWEGGGFKGSEEERKRLLADAQHLGAEYIDVEMRAGFTDLVSERGGKGIVLSVHDFDGVPADLAGQVAAMRATGAEVVKVAAMARRLSDCLLLKHVALRGGSSTVVIGMGEAGLATRILPTRFGSCWTYTGDGAAPGQIPPAQMIEQFSFRSIAERTALYGVVGRPVAHSLSPALHNAAFRATRLDAVYLPLAAADFDDFRQFAAEMRIEGASVTAPFKVDAFECAHESDPVARRVGAVNTVQRRGDRWIGCNTDVEGFLTPLGAAMSLRGARASVMGAGGSARAVCEGLASAGARVTVCARRPAQARTLAQLTDATVGEWPPMPGTWDLLVNTTPIGTSPALDDTPLPGGPFTGRLVYDLVYNPLETRLLRDARAAGCRTIGGLDMLIAQAQRQFEWWTGLRVPERVMREAALQVLKPGPRAGPTLRGSGR
jgi:3-dehydroquinate dehydratase / shikimate dehydrogenase